MSIEHLERQYEREEDDLHERYASGEITEKKYNRLMSEMQRDHRNEMQGIAEDEAQRAYDNVLGEW